MNSRGSPHTGTMIMELNYAERVSVLNERKFALIEVCNELSQICEEAGLASCEAFLANNPKLLNALKDVMALNIFRVKSEDGFQGVEIDLMEVTNDQVHYSLSTSFSTLLPNKFNYFELAKLINCRIWIGAMFRKHLVARAGLARLEQMDRAGTEPLSDLRRIVGTAVITEDLKLLEFLGKVFFRKKGEITIRYEDTVPYIARKNGAMLPGDPFYAAGLLGNFEITFVLLKMCNFEGDPTKKAQHINVTSKALRVRHALSLKSNPYIQLNNIIAAVSDADAKILQDFQDLPFEIPKKLIFDGDKVNDSLHQICAKWMGAGINFPWICEHEKGRLILMTNFRLHFASSTLAKESMDIMLAAAVVNVGDLSLFNYLRRNVFKYRVIKGVLEEKNTKDEKIDMNDGKAYLQVILGKNKTVNYVTYKSAKEAAKRMGLLGDPRWQDALKS